MANMKKKSADVYIGKATGKKVVKKQILKKGVRRTSLKKSVKITSVKKAIINAAEEPIG